MNPQHTTTRVKIGRCPRCRDNVYATVAVRLTPQLQSVDADGKVTAYVNRDITDASIPGHVCSEDDKGATSDDEQPAPDDSPAVTLAGNTLTDRIAEIAAAAGSIGNAVRPTPGPLQA